ncbi:MAG: hypothetical protein J0M17_10015, partial [Planctomycetes bacterium]|nr:hypothetical protein [Planctomycetota bacterium]
MPTFNEISKAYADELRAALNAEFTKKASVVAEDVRGSTTASVLKKIANELENTWQIDGKPLTEEQKDLITDGITESLGIPDPDAIKRVVKSASNDAYMQMVQQISD